MTFTGLAFYLVQCRMQQSEIYCTINQFFPLTVSFSLQSAKPTKKGDKKRDLLCDLEK